MLDVAQTGDAWRSLWPCGKPILQQAPGRACGPMEGPMLSRFSDRPWGPGVESRLELSILKDCTPWKESTLEQFMEPRRTRIGEVSGGLSPMGWAPCWCRRNVRSPPLRRKEQQRQRVMELTATPPFPIPLHRWGEEGEKIVRQVKLKKKGELRKGVFRI